MKIAEISFHGCIRAHKKAMCLASMGHSVHFVANYIAPSHSVSGYDGVHMFNVDTPEHGLMNERQLANTTRLLSKEVDIFSVNNEPNWIFKTVRENTDKPVVWDIHDWTSIRDNALDFELEMERYALDNADAFVVPSKGYLKKIRAEKPNKPSLLVYSKVPEFLFAKTPMIKKHGIVYEGGLKGKDENQLYNYPYRNWAQFIKKVVAGFQNGNKAYLISANDGDDFSDYIDDKIELKMPMLYNELIQEMSQYDCGLAGTPYPLKDFTDSMPNKLFEYIAAGIPVIAVNSKEAGKFLEDNELGLSVSDASEVPMAMERLRDHSVKQNRWKFAMEGEVPSLLNLYGDLCAPPQRFISQI